MNIEELNLTNFKAFAEESVPLGAVTLLSGLNSSGKSSVLQALALIRQSSDANALTMVGGGNGLLLNGDLVELGTGRDVRHENWIVGNRGEGDIQLAIKFGGDVAVWAAAYQQEADLLPLVSSADGGQVATLNLFGPGFQYLRADRINPAVSYPRSHDVAVRREFLGAKGQHTVNFLRHFQDREVIEVLRHPGAASTSLLRQCEAWLGDLCPGVNLAATGIEGTDTVRLSYSFGTAGLSSSNQYRPTNVGFGLTYVLPIVVACLTAAPGSLLLLENPEAHLHPRGQSSMAGLIARAGAAGAQVVVESHSDHVLNGLRIAVRANIIAASDLKLLYFSLGVNGRRITSPEVDTAGRLSHWPDGFFDEWDNALDKLID